MHPRPAGVLFACLLLVAAGSAVATPGETTIEEVGFGGMGFVAVEGNTTFVWQSENATVDVTVTTGGVSEPNHEVCVRAPSLERGERELGCEHERLENNSTTTVSVPVSGWPDAVAGGSLSLEVALRKGLTDTVVNEANASVTVISKDGQFDGDQLSNRREVELGTRISAQDTDGDGLWDGEEVDRFGSSPLSKDTDSDGVPDAVEVNYGTDPALEDTDDDGLSDDAEINQYGTDPLDDDTDDDGVSDGREVHQLGTNPRLASADSDGDLLSDELELRLGTDPGSPLSPWGYVVALAAAGAVAVTQLYRAGWRVRRQRGDVGGRRVRLPTVTRVDGDGESNPLARPESLRRTDSEGSADPTGSGDAASETPGAGSSGVVDAGADGSPGGSSASDSSASELPDEAFLTDADRVRKLLEAAGGNCRQQDIVRETGWSKSKVSRLLSRMADDGEVRKISLGRENVIVLPGEEPDAVRSALDDERR